MSENVAVWIDHKEARICRVLSEGADEEVVLAPHHLHHKHPRGPEGVKAHPEDDKRFFHEGRAGHSKAATENPARWPFDREARVSQIRADAPSRARGQNHRRGDLGPSHRRPASGPCKGVFQTHGRNALTPHGTRGTYPALRASVTDSNEIRDHFVTVEGVRLHWAEVGKASDATPLVLLHGLNNSCLSFARVAPLLATDRRVLMPDLPGHGQSERPNVAYELDWYARMIAGWLEALGLEQVDIVGHSFGGGVAQMLLLRCPERMRRLVLVAAGGLGKDVGRWLRLASLPYVVEYLGQPFMPLGTHLALRNVKEGVTRRDIAEPQPSQRAAGARHARSHGASAT